ncbi:Endonuclease-reverse transcriptase [Popillia japonica]|uniref:Endonuclease-reverse transcriptase n=1 Tax=Popillia japonica TaxID=7064 RepID=A0AAW1NDE5_POPJA
MFTENNEADKANTKWSQVERKRPRRNISVGTAGNDALKLRAADKKLWLFIEAMSTILIKILQQYNKGVRIILAGDFNINVTANNRDSRDLLNTLLSFGLKHTIFGLKHTITQATRIQGSSASTIDNVFTNLHDFITSVLAVGLSDHKGILAVGLSDHKGIQFNIKKQPLEQNYIKSRSLTQQNYENFKNCIKSQRWTDSTTIKDVNTKHDLFLTQLIAQKKALSAIEEVPQKTHCRQLFIKNKIMSLPSLQKKALSAIEEVPQKTHCRQLFIKNKIMSLPSAYIYKQLIYARLQLSSLKRKGEGMPFQLRSKQHKTT